LKRTESRLRFEKKGSKKERENPDHKKKCKNTLQCLEFVKLEDLTGIARISFAL
jgi:hypothetical protein